MNLFKKTLAQLLLVVVITNSSHLICSEDPLSTRELKRQIGERNLKERLGESLDAICDISIEGGRYVGSGSLITLEDGSGNVAILSAGHLLKNSIREIIRTTPDLKSLEAYVTIPLLGWSCAFGETVTHSPVTNDIITEKYTLTKAVVLREFIEELNKILVNYGEEAFLLKGEPTSDFAFFTLETIPATIAPIPLLEIVVGSLNTQAASCYFSPLDESAQTRTKGCAFSPVTTERGGWYKSMYFDPNMSTELEESDRFDPSSLQTKELVKKFNKDGREIHHTVRRAVPSNSGGPLLAPINGKWHALGVISGGYIGDIGERILTSDERHRNPAEGDYTGFTSLVYELAGGLLIKSSVKEMFDRAITIEPIEGTF